MKKMLIIGFFLILLIASCEKSNDDTSILKFYGDAREDIGYAIAPTGSDYIIVGLFTDITRINGNNIESSDRNMGILKVDNNGNQKWKLSAGGIHSDAGSSLVVLSDGSVVCTGLATDTTSAGNSQTDIFIVKVSPDGSLIWQNKIGGPEGNQVGSDILLCSDGGFLIVGYTDVYRAQVGSFSENIAGKKDIFIVKTNSQGALLWSTAYGFGGDDTGVKIKEDKNGGYILLGTTDTSDPGQGKNNMILIKINSLGGVMASKILGTADDEYAADFEVLNDGYIVVGTIVNGVDDQQILAIRLTTNIFAAPLFSSKFEKESDGTTSSRVNAVTSADGGKFILAGQAGPDLSADMLIMVLDENGEESGTAFISGGPGLQTANDVLTDSGGNVIAIGKSFNKNNSLISFLKFRF